MSQQNISSNRNFIIGIIATILVMAAVGSIALKMVGLEFGATGPAPAIEAEVEATKVYSDEALAAGKKLGKEIYDMACTVCHTPGIAGAPRIGDSASWVSRIDKGEATLIYNAINGLNVMQPRGGSNELSDEEVEWAVRYMLDAVK